ncbi:MAG: PRC-barrel domain-containing protein [Candidatus Promineifilaceae bacterium]|nr:PRC-barrel domain-containing protein [Candidatus Promineifilaceae bacterium]
MRFSKDLIGKPIFSTDEGRHLGTVRDVYLDKALAWLAGIHLGREGLISRKALVIPREAIAVFGVDVILAKTADAVTDDKEMADIENWLRLEKLQGRQVDTPGGTRVGTLGDVMLDEEARIVGFSLSRVHVEGPVAENPIIMRDAVLDIGGDDDAMTIDLSKVERQTGMAEATGEGKAKEEQETES